MIFIINQRLLGPVANSSRGAQQMLVHKKIMFDRYYCIRHSVMREKIENVDETAPVHLYL